MPTITGSGYTAPSRSLSGANTAAPLGVVNELLVSEILGKYSTLAKLGKLFNAYATLTAPVLFSTAAGTGGPLLWNPPGSNIDLHLVAVGFQSLVVTTVAGGLGITGNTGQTAAPTSTTAIDKSGNCYVGGAASGASAFRVGTVANAGGFFVPFAQFHTGALTVDTTGTTWIPFDGMFIAGPGSWLSVAASATLSTLQVSVTAIWAELPF